MKRIVSLVLLVVCLVATLASCGPKGFDYRNTDLSPYVTVPKLEGLGLKADIADLADTITDDDVNEKIDEALEGAAAYKQKLTSFEIKWGDTVGLIYKGVLASTLTAANLNADGTGLTADQIKNLTGFSGGEITTPTELKIGSGQMIDGFESSLVGLSVTAENSNALYPIQVTFPETYKEESLAGKDAVFFITASYKWAPRAEKEIDFKDIIAMTYEIKLNEESSAYAEFFEGATKEPQSGIYTLSKNSLFHSNIIIHFNDLLKEGKGFGTEMTWTTDDETVDVPAAEEGNPDDQVAVKVDYKVTVHGFTVPACFTHDDVVATPAAGETVPEGKISFKDFLSKLQLKEEDYADYPTFFAESKKDMQTEREITIKANRLKSAFNALVAASEVRLDHADMKELIENYKAEVRGNIDYVAATYKASGMGDLYLQVAASQGITTLEEYAMYTLYGYRKSTLETQLKTDAEEFVSQRLVFWQFVKDNNVTLTDEEYEAGLANYKTLYENDKFMEENELTEEAVYEALLWDKVAEEIAKTVTYTKKPAAEA